MMHLNYFCLYLIQSNSFDGYYLATQKNRICTTLCVNSVIAYIIQLC